MANVFIIYGVGGTPQENWFPWLKQELEKQGHTVYIPLFPTPKNQILEEWLKVADQYKDIFDQNDTILVGHSLGAIFALHLCQKYPIKAAYLVGGFAQLPGNKFDPYIKTFVTDFDWPKINQNCPEFQIFHGDNDPYVNMDKAVDLAKKTGGTLTVIPNGGHLNATAGFTKFDLLFEKIKNL